MSDGEEGKSGLICLVPFIRSCWCRRVSRFVVTLDNGKKQNGVGWPPKTMRNSSICVRSSLKVFQVYAHTTKVILNKYFFPDLRFHLLKDFAPLLFPLLLAIVEDPWTICKQTRWVDAKQANDSRKIKCWLQNTQNGQIGVFNKRQIDQYCISCCVKRSCPVLEKSRVRANVVGHSFSRSSSSSSRSNKQTTNNTLSTKQGKITSTYHWSHFATTHSSPDLETTRLSGS